MRRPSRKSNQKTSVLDEFLRILGTGAVTAALLVIAAFCGRSLIGQWFAKSLIDYQSETDTKAHTALTRSDRLDRERATAADAIMKSLREIEHLLERDPSTFDSLKANPKSQTLQWIELLHEKEQKLGELVDNLGIVATGDQTTPVALYWFRIREGVVNYLAGLEHVELTPFRAEDELRQQLRSVHAEAFEHQE